MITIAAASSNWIWYFGRATGFVALVMMTAIIVLGVAGRMRVVTDRWPRFALGTLHRDLALMALLVLTIHIAAAVLDTYVSVPLLAAVVPFISRYQPFWVGMGALALDVMLAVIVTSLLRRRIGLRVWKAVHWLNYGVWPLAVAHGLGIGSDSGSTWAVGVTVTCCLVVTAAVLARVLYGSSPQTSLPPLPAGPTLRAPTVATTSPRARLGHAEGRADGRADGRTAAPRRVNTHGRSGTVRPHPQGSPATAGASARSTRDRLAAERVR